MGCIPVHGPTSSLRQGTRREAATKHEICCLWPWNHGDRQSLNTESSKQRDALKGHQGRLQDDEQGKIRCSRHETDTSGQIYVCGNSHKGDTLLMAASVRGSSYDDELVRASAGGGLSDVEVINHAAFEGDLEAQLLREEMLLLAKTDGGNAGCRCDIVCVCYSECRCERECQCHTEGSSCISNCRSARVEKGVSVTSLDSAYSARSECHKKFTAR